MLFPLFAATIFGQNQKLEPVSPEKKSMWKREMICLLAVCDHMVEFFPSLQALPNGTSVEVKKFQKFSSSWSQIHFCVSSSSPAFDTFLFFLQVMTSRPRSDIHINLPALQKLDTMLQVIQAPFAKFPGLFGGFDSEVLEFCFTGYIR